MKAFRVLLAGCVLAFFGSGCAFIGLKQQIQPMADAAALNGTLSNDAPQPAAYDSAQMSPMAVVVFKEEGGVKKIVRYKLMYKAGSFRFLLPPGTYSLAAFEDTNGDFVYQAAENAGVLKEPARVVLGPASSVSGLNLSISHERPERLDVPVNLSSITPGADATRQQLRIGKVLSLDDPRFDDASGEMGLWKYDRFRKEIGGGLFFLEPYDKDKIPVLFVHGYTGTPRDFKKMVERLDRKKYQPWFAFYPSAARIAIIAEHLNSAVIQLQMTYHFKELYVVGYSMGGLVSRSFILQNAEETHKGYIPLFISIATPWNGHYMADMRNLAPTEVPSWQDLATNSEFLLKIFSKPLPEGTKYYLFFGYEGDRNPLRKNNDRFITIESALHPRAQEEASGVYGFNVNHENILDLAEVSEKLAQIFEASEAGRANFIAEVGGDVTEAGKKIAGYPLPLINRLIIKPLSGIKRVFAQAPAQDKAARP
ncbi:MAG: alpha/beta hydrolase [Candidatus Omnitrophota bacterium]|jgi:pimeloyl-ACP methyl ester carboxylesterase